MSVVRGVREVNERVGIFRAETKWGWEAFVQNGSGSIACAHLHKSVDAALRCASVMVKAGGHEVNVPDRPRRRRKAHHKDSSGAL